MDTPFLEALLVLAEHRVGPSLIATSAHTESFFGIGAKMGSNLDSLSISIVTAATRGYLLPAAEAPKAARSTCITPGCRSPSFANELLCFLLLPYRQGNSCLWSDVRIDDVRATWDEWLESPATLDRQVLLLADWHLQTIRTLHLLLEDLDLPIGQVEEIDHVAGHIAE